MVATTAIVPSASSIATKMSMFRSEDGSRSLGSVSDVGGGAGRPVAASVSAAACARPAACACPGRGDGVGRRTGRDRLGDSVRGGLRRCLETAGEECRQDHRRVVEPTSPTGRNGMARFDRAVRLG